MLKPIDAHAAARMLDQGQAVLVDVRETGEFARTSIPGTTNLPLSRLEAGVPGTGPVVFLCLSGMRTARHAGGLAGLVPGRTAHVLQGGLQAWRAAGLPVREAPGRFAGWLARLKRGLGVA